MTFANYRKSDEQAALRWDSFRVADNSGVNTEWLESICWVR